jgi:hypothetical protein
MSEKTATVPVVALTPFAAAKFVNEALKEAGVTKPIPPQMMYNYTKSRLNAGKTPAIAYTEKGGVDPKALEEWTTKYVAMRVAKQSALNDADAQDTEPATETVSS